MRIEKYIGKLSKKEKKIVEYMIKNPLESITHISTKLNISRSTICRVINNNNSLLKLAEGNYDEDLIEFIKEIRNKAMDVVVKALNSKNEHVRLKASLKILSLTGVFYAKNKEEIPCV